LVVKKKKERKKERRNLSYMIFIKHLYTKFPGGLKVKRTAQVF